MRYCLALIFFLSAALLIAQSTVESVPNQKLINGSHVSNPDRILSETTVSQIDNILKATEDSTSVQIALVVVESIGEADIFDFAQQLFNTWGIGNKENNNGLLILFVNDQHTIRFHTGDGIEGVLPDVVCKRIQREYMVPEFKNGNYDAGMIAGLLQVQKILADPEYSNELQATTEDETSDLAGLLVFAAIFIAPVVLVIYIIKATSGKFADSKNGQRTDYPEMLLKRWTWLIEFVAAPLLIIFILGVSPIDNAFTWGIFALYCYFIVTLFHRLARMKKVINRFLIKQDYYEIVEFLRKQQWYWLSVAFLFPLPFAFYFFYHLARKRIYRNHPRNCKACGGNMKKLDEVKEDEFLSAGQQMEEKLHAVDYDVWQCAACQSIEVWFYLNRHSKYQSCPKCKTLAYHFVSRRTVESATYSSSGSGEEVHACKFCGYQKKSPYSIPMLMHSTSNSSSSSSSDSSSSSGSWGGGSSSGGGASSSW